MWKRISVFLVLAMVLTLIPAQVWAVAGSGIVEQEGCVTSQIVYRDSDAAVVVGPTLAEGNYVRWIDRISLPSYGTAFYAWLEDNATVSGALSDPTVATLRNGMYVHKITSAPGSVSYTYADGEDPVQAAEDAVIADGNDKFQSIMAYAVAVYSAFDRDHPEVFWLTGSSQYSWSISYDHSYSDGEGTASYTVSVYFLLKTDSFDLRQSHYQDPALIGAAIEQRDADVARILADCPTDLALDDQIRYLNQVLTTTNCYNSDISSVTTKDPWECTSALSGSVGLEGPVCEGYARAFKVLCDRLGIGCVLVEGDAQYPATTSVVAHMWNYVQLGESWYAVDVTWNDPSAVGMEDPVSGYETEDWLLLGSDSEVGEDLTFLDTHPVTNVVTSGGVDFCNGPVLSTDAYVRPAHYMDMAPYRSGGGSTAPVSEGEVFAGWFYDEALTEAVSPGDTTGWAYAKFVSADTMSVKYQLTADTTAASATTDMRLLTAVDSLGFRQVSFRVEFAGSTQVISSRTVYRQIKAEGVTIEDPGALFGEDAEYFVTYTLLDIPQAAFETAFTVTACWQTLDGTSVYGGTRSFRISDTFS